MNMIDILVDMKAVEILAEDMHYHTGGRSFYANHLLADLVKNDYGSIADQLKETYWLGELRSFPPHSDEIMEKAIELVRQLRNRSECHVKNLFDAVELLACGIDKLKNEEAGGIMSGTVAVLDGLSQKALVALGLLARTLEDA